MMKTIRFILIALYAAACISCEEAPREFVGTLSPYISIYDVRNLYDGEDVVLTSENLSEASMIVGVVNSSATDGNAPEGTVVIQNVRRSVTCGISIELGDASSTLDLGDSIAVNVVGKTLTRQNGALMIRGISSEDVEVLSEGHTLSPVSVTIDELYENPEDYECLYVSVSNCLLSDSEMAGQKYGGDLTVNAGDELSDIIISVRDGSSIADLTIPETPTTYCGLFFYDDDVTLRIMPVTEDDIIARYMILGWDMSWYYNNYEYTEDCPAYYVRENIGECVLKRGPSLESQTASNAFSSAWPVDADLASAQANGSYYEFSIVPENGAEISVYSIDIALRVQTSAPDNYMWFYSIDGGETFEAMSEMLTFQGSKYDNDGIMQPTLDVSSVTALQNFTTPVIIRLYAWGATQEGRSFRIGKTLSTRQYAVAIEGEVS